MFVFKTSACLSAGFCRRLADLALAIELAYESAQSLHHQGYDAHAAWVFVSAGFAAGAIIYYSASLFLEQKGAAVRYVTQFREYALARKQADASEQIKLLAKCDLMRHLPAEQIEQILPCIRDHRLKAGEILFRPATPVTPSTSSRAERSRFWRTARGMRNAGRGDRRARRGHAFGEMALLSGGPRTATIRAVEDTDLLKIGKDDFDQLVATDPQLADAVKRISHQRAISNLSAGGTDAGAVGKGRKRKPRSLNRHETGKLLTETANGAGMAIVFGNILDTIPGCLVIGAKFTAFGNLSLTLMLGMFLGGIPEAAASASMLTKAGYRPAAIFGLWSTVLLAGVIAAAAGKAFIGSSDALTAIFAQAVAGGAVLALVAHAMIPVALEEGGSLVVLPTVAGFLFALYLALAESFVLRAAAC